MIVCIKENYLIKCDNISNNIENYRKDNFHIVELDEKYSDCQYSDFNSDFTFNPVKYQTRKTIELSKQKIEEFKSKLASLDYKTIKYTQGELSFEEFEKVKEECKYYRNEINSLENMLKNS